MNVSSKSISMVFFILNFLYALGIVLLLLIALVLQFVFDEQPCPLCLLQRVGFLITSLGYLFNLRFGFRPGHYVISLLGALFTTFVALRQIALHVVPGTGGYGPEILGFHLYTWCFIVSMLIIIFTCFLLAFDQQYMQKQPTKRFHQLRQGIFALVMLIAATNLVATFVECGFSECPDNPSGYKEISSGRIKDGCLLLRLAQAGQA